MQIAGAVIGILCGVLLIVLVVCCLVQSCPLYRGWEKVLAYILAPEPSWAPTWTYPRRDFADNRDNDRYLRLMEELEAAKRDKAGSKKEAGLHKMRMVLKHWENTILHRALTGWLMNVVMARHQGNAIDAATDAQLRLQKLRTQRTAGEITEQEYKDAKAALKAEFKAFNDSQGHNRTQDIQGNNEATMILNT